MLTLPKVSTTKKGLMSWRYLAPKLWNALPDSLRKESGLNSFKRHLRKLNLSWIFQFIIFCLRALLQFALYDVFHSIFSVHDFNIFIIVHSIQIYIHFYF